MSTSKQGKKKKKEKTLWQDMLKIKKTLAEQKKNKDKLTNSLNNL